MEMKAAVLITLRDPLLLQSHIQIPNLRRHQVRVKIAYTGVCHSQVMEVQGRRGEDRFLPHLLGHEATGLVEEVGEGVSRVKPGDRVILGWIKGAGGDDGGVQYSCGGKVINAGGVATFAERAVVSENRCFRLPDDIPMDVGVLFGCALPTGAGIVLNSLRVTKQSTVAIIGIGGVGFSALMLARAYEPRILIAVDVEEKKLQLAKEYGATHTLSPAGGDFVQQIQALTDGRGADYVIDCAGQKRTIEQAFEATRRGGTCVFASHPHHGEKISIDPYELICGKQLLGSWGGGCVPERDFPRLFEFYREGKLPLQKMITRRYSLEQINEALADLENRRVLRPLVEIDPALK